MKYAILEASDSTELEQLVNERLAEGWALCGGVAVIVHETTDRDGFKHGYWTYYQAMTKANPNPVSPALGIVYTVSTPTSDKEQG